MGRVRTRVVEDDADHAVGGRDVGEVPVSDGDRVERSGFGQLMQKIQKLRQRRAQATSERRPEHVRQALGRGSKASAPTPISELPRRKGDA